MLLNRSHLLCFMVGCLLFAVAAPAVAQAPRAVSDLRSLLEQTSCVVDAQVTDIVFGYDDRLGPRTTVQMNDIKPLVGSCSYRTLSLPLLGGPTRDGKFMRASEVPRFSKGVRYVVFLRNTEWFFSPVHFHHVLRVDSLFGREVLVDNSGVAVRGIARSGLVREGRQLTHQENEGGHLTPPRALANLTVDDLKLAITRSTLAARLQQYASLQGIAVGGTYRPEPQAGRAWNRLNDVKASPTTVTPPPGCDPLSQSCL